MKISVLRIFYDLLYELSIKIEVNPNISTNKRIRIFYEFICVFTYFLLFCTLKLNYLPIEVSAFNWENISLHPGSLILLWCFNTNAELFGS